MKTSSIIISAVLALAIAVTCLICIERIDVGNVGVVYSSRGVEDETLSQGWHFISPMKRVKEFPVSQQQIVFSNDPADYNQKEHPDWSIDAPADGGMVGINLTVNYNFIPEKVVDLYKRFNGMDGETLVESRIQNSIIAYVKEVTPRFTVMDIYSEKKSEVNQAITTYLNEQLSTEYGINISSALIIDVQLDEALQAKIRAKEEAKQDAEIAELARQTALAQAETDKVVAQSKADVEIIEAQAEAEINRVMAQAEAEANLILAQAEADSNRAVASSITPELIQHMEAEARVKHGWVTVQGGSVVADAR